jgi:hypothetical protein
VEIKSWIKEMIDVPFEGHEERWFRFAAKLGVDAAHISSLVETVLRGRWKTSRSPRLYLQTMSARDFARRAKELGQLPTADIFKPWGNKSLERYPRGVEANGKIKGCPESLSCELMPDGEDETDFMDSVDTENMPTPRYVPQSREERLANKLALDLFDGFRKRLSPSDWTQLVKTYLVGWDREEIRVLQQRARGKSFTNYMKLHPAERRQLLSADRRVRRKLQALGQRLRRRQ